MDSNLKLTGSNEILNIKTRELEEGLYVVILQLRGRVIDVFYMRTGSSGEAGLQPFAEKIVKAFNEKTLRVMVDNAYLCRVNPLRKNAVVDALEKARRDGVSELEVEKFPVRSIELELAKALVIKGFRFWLKRWVGGVCFDLMIQVYNERRILLDIPRLENRELTLRKMKFVKGLAERHNIDFVYYYVREGDAHQRFLEMLHVLEKIILQKEVRPSGRLLIEHPKAEETAQEVELLLRRRAGSRFENINYVDVFAGKQDEAGPVRVIKLGNNLCVNVQKLCDTFYHHLGVYYSFSFDDYARLLNRLMEEMIVTVNVRVLGSRQPKPPAAGGAGGEVGDEVCPPR